MAVFLINDRPYAIGRNTGILGVGHYNNLLVPTELPYLPKIRKVYNFCDFTIVIDFDNYMWVCGSRTSNPLCNSHYENYANAFIKSIGDVKHVVQYGSGLLVLCYDNILYQNGKTRVEQNHKFEEFTKVLHNVSDIDQIGSCLFINWGGQVYVKNYNEFPIRIDGCEFGNLIQRRQNA